MPTYTTNYNLAKPLVNNATDQDLWGGELNDDMDIIDTTMKSISDVANAASAAIVPVGSIVDYAGSSAPSGWLLLYGQAISRVTYSALFAILGTTYGPGDGSTTFNLPDLRGFVVGGRDNMGGSAAGRLTSTTISPDGNTLGASGGAQTHTLSTNEMPSHTHGFDSSALVNASISGSQRGFIQSGAFSSGGINFGTSSTGGGNPHNNVQPTIILNKIIKT